MRSHPSQQCKTICSVPFSALSCAGQANQDAAVLLVTMHPRVLEKVRRSDPPAFISKYTMKYVVTLRHSTVSMSAQHSVHVSKPQCQQQAPSH